MKGKTILVLMMITLLPSVFAHQRTGFNINGEDYIFLVGSLNEPVYVDDKTGIDLRVKIADPQDPTNFNSQNAKIVEGLEKTLKAKIISDKTEKEYTLSAVHGELGSYKTTHYFTKTGHVMYNIYGTIDGTPVDLIFHCNEKGHVMHAEEEASEIKISDKILQTFQAGSFGCPSEKDATFPDKYFSNKELSEKAGNSEIYSLIAISISIIALISSIILIGRKK